MENETAPRNSLRSLIAGGAEIAGGAIGGALGFFAAGPMGAAALGAGGSVAGLALTHVGEEIADRYLGTREKVRVGGVLALSADKIKERIEAGESVRSDGFFKPKPDGRPDAEEVAESILLVAQREAEEKKLPYMANLLASVAFDRRLSGPLAHQIIKVAEALTYRQLCLMKLFSPPSGVALRSENYRGGLMLSWPLLDVLSDSLNLYNRGLINSGPSVVFNVVDLIPSLMTTQGVGVLMVDAMKLKTISMNELEPLVVELSRR